MLRLPVLTLATLVQESPKLLTLEEARRLRIELRGDVEDSNYHFAYHLGLLTRSISELLDSA
jgi:hypothetical protein